MGIQGFCNTTEGWGPSSLHQADFTVCFEDTILLGLPAIIAITSFLLTAITMKTTGKPHSLGRVNAIYFPSQFLILASATALLVRAILLSRIEYSPAAMLSTVSMLLAWILALPLNHLQHQQGIHSNDQIFALFVLSIIASAINIRTMHRLDQSQDQQFKAFVAFFVFNTLGFIVEAWPRGRTRVQQKSGTSPSEHANLFSRITFHFLQPIISQGFKTPLVAKDIMGMVPQRITTEFSYVHLSQRWSAQVAKSAAKNKKPSLFWTALKAHGLRWVPVMIHRTMASIMGFASPLLLKELLVFIESYRPGATPQPLAKGIILAILFFCASIITSFFMAQYFQTSMCIGLEIRTGLISMIYRKSLRLSNATKQKSTAGEINNHMSVDAERWPEAATFLPMLISTPFEVAVATWLLYEQLGWSVLIGLASIFLMTPFQTFSAKFFNKAKTAKLEFMDSRIRLMNEILSGIKIVKLYGWEDSFKEKVDLTRKREVSTLRRIGIVTSYLTILYQSAPLIVAIVTFSVYATVGGPGFTPGLINSQKIFVSITLLNLLNHPLGMMAPTIAAVIGIRVASRRVEQFLLAEEIANDVREVDETLPQDPSIPLIEIKDAVFAWEIDGPQVETPKERRIREKAADKKYNMLVKESREAGKPTPEKEVLPEKSYGPTLTDINLSVPRGNLTAVVGRVGQGKTSLLSALIGDMYKREGTCKIRGRVAFTAQQPWVVNATLRDNILFGEEFDQARYDTVLMCCSLFPDIAMLPAGDQTEIGERGINLSGGQKQRVSLARAAYQNADIYLLDDPLSAVDAHVDQHLWEHLIGPEGLLKNKTRILVTHGIHHLEHVDQIVVIKDGKISETGQYAGLMAAKDAFYQLITEYSVSQGTTSQSEKAKADGQPTEELNESTEDGDEKEDTKVDLKKDYKAELIADEKMVLGNVSWNVYLTYAKAASYRYAIGVLLIFALSQAFQIGTNVWLKYWASNADKKENSLALYLSVYSGLVLCFMIMNVLAGYFSFVLAAIRASHRLHERLLGAILRLPMSFFETTPLGRIVNRFSSDIYSIDEVLPFNFMNVILCAVGVLGTIIVIGASTPLFLCVVPPLAFLYWLAQTYYIRSSRALKRIDSVSKSPIYQHFSETLSGVSTIRAMAIDRRFIRENAAKADMAANAYFSWFVSNRWLQIRLEALGSTIVLASALFAVLGRHSLDASTVGLALSYSLNVTMDITWLVRSYTDLLNQLVAVERVNEYCNKNPEAPAEMDVQLPENWPQAGHVEFRNYSTRYRHGLDLVIKNISFEVQPAEKVGIVGRTGAGKSSLTLALFRIIEAANSHWANASQNGQDNDADPSKEDKVLDLEKVAVHEDGGSIWIDGIDISTVGLKYLRQHLAIIPQDPTLFVGTVRENLDPFGEVKDADLWEALERAHLKDYISSLSGGLSFMVSQNGDNFSVGQRSLICLARALLRKTKILILDEATAAVDVETDELIQKTIRQEFKDRTILTIAHRIKTVMDSDKILVLERGHVEEFESPAVLLQRPDSLFYALAQQAGEVKEGKHA